MNSGGSEGDPADQAAAPENIEHLVGLYLAGLTETEFYVLHHTAIPGTADPVPRSMRVLCSIRSAEVLDAPVAVVHSGRLQRVAAPTGGRDKPNWLRTACSPFMPAAHCRGAHLVSITRRIGSIPSR